MDLAAGIAVLTCLAVLRLRVLQTVTRAPVYPRQSAEVLIEESVSFSSALPSNTRRLEYTMRISAQHEWY